MPRVIACLLTLLIGSSMHAADLPPGVSQPLVLAPGPGNPRNSEGDFIQLKSGRVLFIYTHFTGGTGDAAAAFLASRSSDDNGKTWSDRDDIVVKQIGKQNVMSVSLLRLADGRIALFYLVKNGTDDCRVNVQFSSDETKTWTDPKPCMPEGSGYFVMNNNRAVQLSKSKPGRIILPVAQHRWKEDKPGQHRGIAMCYYSDDNGVTFKKSETELQAPPESRSGLQEPLVVELKDGSLMMLARTDRSCQFRSISKDAGKTWSPAEATDIASPLSPASVARIPKTGDLLMVWNDHEKIDEKLKSKRTPLTVAISQDEGKTWTQRQTLYSDPEGWYCYTAISFAGDRVLLGHCAGKQAKGSSGLATSVVTTFDVNWIYKNARAFVDPGGAKRVVYVVSAAGVMTGMFATVKEQLNNAFVHLPEGTLFDVVFFQDGRATTLSLDRMKKDDMLPATSTNRRNASAFLEEMTVSSTNDPMAAIEFAFRRKPDLIYFLTGGDFPDNGEVVKTFELLNKNRTARVHTIAIYDEGRDPHSEYLEVLKKIAAASGGQFFMHREESAR